MRRQHSSEARGEPDCTVVLVVPAWPATTTGCGDTIRHLDISLSSHQERNVRTIYCTHHHGKTFVNFVRQTQLTALGREYVCGVWRFLSAEPAQSRHFCLLFCCSSSQCEATTRTTGLRGGAEEHYPVSWLSSSSQTANISQWQQSVVSTDVFYRKHLLS